MFVALARGGARQHRAARLHRDDMRRLAGLDFHEIADRRALCRVHVALEEMTRRLGAEQRFAVMQLIAGTVLCHHAGQPPAVRRQGVPAPTNMAQSLDDVGLGHGA
jgi:hypothetical protein